MKVIFNLSDYHIEGSLEEKGLSLKTLNSLLSLITHKYIYSETEAIRINSTLMKNKTSDYREYLNLLKNAGILIWNNYEVGVKSRDYFFTPGFKEHAYISKIIADNDDEQTYLDQDNSIAINDGIKNRLLNDLENVSVDMTKIKKSYYIDAKTDKEIYEFKKYIRSYLNASRFITNKLFFNWKSKRLYTPFTYCSKEVRLNAFNFNGDKLASLDIPSSHPLFMALWVINKGINSNDYDFKEWCSNVKEKRRKDKAVFYSELRIQFDKMRNTDGNEIYNPDLNIFTRFDKKHISYDDAKEFFMRWLNSEYKNDFIHNTFRQYYPEIDKLKQENMYDKIVALETNFIMNKMVGTLYKKFPEIKILTCHDEIYFPEKYLDKVLPIWNSLLDELYNRLPGKVSTDIIEDNEFNIKAPTLKELNPFKKRLTRSEMNKGFDWDKFLEDQNIFNKK